MAGNGLRKQTCVCACEEGGIWQLLHYTYTHIMWVCRMQRAQTKPRPSVKSVRDSSTLIGCSTSPFNLMNRFLTLTMPHIWMRETNFCVIVIHLPFLLLAMRHVTLYAYINTHTHRNNCDPAVTDRDVEPSVEWDQNNSVLITAAGVSYIIPILYTRQTAWKQRVWNTHKCTCRENRLERKRPDMGRMQRKALLCEFGSE